MVADYIADVLDQPENESNIKLIKKKVGQLTNEFPVYG